MPNDMTKRGPGRPRKAEDEVAEATQPRRRRKEGGEEVIGRKLAVRMSELDFANFKYRWVNDEMGSANGVGPRIMAKTVDDDWDIVRQGGSVVKHDSADLGDAVSAVVGVRPDGKPMLAYLLRKPKAYYEEDRAKKHAELDKQLKDLRRGISPSKGDEADYVPRSGISMS